MATWSTRTHRAANPRNESILYTLAFVFDPAHRYPLKEVDMTLETIVLSFLMAGIIMVIIDGKQYEDSLSPEDREKLRKEIQDDLRIW